MSPVVMIHQIASSSDHEILQLELKEVTLTYFLKFHSYLLYRERVDFDERNSDILAQHFGHLDHMRWLGLVSLFFTHSNEAPQIQGISDFCSTKWFLLSTLPVCQISGEGIGQFLIFKLGS